MTGKYCLVTLRNVEGIVIARRPMIEWIARELQSIIRDQLGEYQPPLATLEPLSDDVVDTTNAFYATDIFGNVMKELKVDPTLAENMLKYPSFRPPGQLPDTPNTPAEPVRVSLWKPSALLAVGPPSSGGGCGGPTSGPGHYEQPIFKPELAHRVRRNPASGTWDVIGPDGSYKAWHHEDEAQAEAAFWSGDNLHAEEYRRRALCRRGLIPKEDL